MAVATMERPFRLPPLGKRTRGDRLWRAATPVLERMLALPALNQVYADAHQKSDAREFCDRVLEALNIVYSVEPSGHKPVPSSGPFVVVANHPFGGAEGLILAALLKRIRPDVKLLANSLLHCIPEMRDLFLFVDPFGGSTAASRNVGSMREAIRWLQRGGCLGVFPAGEVSHFSFRQRCITDPAWSTTVARIIQAAHACVLPVYFEGHNRRLFQAAGLVHPRLRTALLPRELLNKRSKTFRVRVGGLIPYSRLESWHNPEDITDYLRFRTYLLKVSKSGGPAAEVESTTQRALPHAAHRFRRQAPVVEPISPEMLARETGSLPSESCLLESGPLRVFCAEASRIPAILREIGRLREMTFREVGEGTGRELDLDRFDPHYLHLFLWHQENRGIVGAYRLGLTDEILGRFGLSGLYTSTLFRYKRGLLRQFGPALEVGRSFVVAEYQRSHSPLMLLWKGIGRFVVRNPRYRMLFGPVSISDEYASMTKQLLMAFLRRNNFRSDLERLVQPRHPPRLWPFRDCEEAVVSRVVRSLDEVDELVREIESDGKQMPVLLRQYLKLNAKLLGFNVDSDFGDVIDGLMLVDLTQLDRPILDRYLGKEGAESLLRFHRASLAS